MWKVYRWNGRYILGDLISKHSSESAALKKAKKEVGHKKIEREEISLQSKIDMVHDHEYDPDCEFCCNNEFVKQAEDAKIFRAKSRHQLTVYASIDMATVL